MRRCRPFARVNVSQFQLLALVLQHLQAFEAFKPSRCATAMKMIEKNSSTGVVTFFCLKIHFRYSVSVLSVSPMSLMPVAR